MSPVSKGLLFAFAVATSTGVTSAAEVLVPGRGFLLRDAVLLKIVARPPSGTSFSIPAAGGPSDPTVSPSAVAVFDTADDGNMSDDLTAGSWTALGNPPGAKGYRYQNPGAGAGLHPVRTIIVKPSLIKVVTRDDGTLDGPISGNAGLVLILGADEYCAEFGGTEVRNQAGLVVRRNAPAPIVCPAPPPPCCNGDAFFSFSTADAPGDCGDIVDSGGMVVANLACNGFFVGGGGNSSPLPWGVPDQGSSIAKITSCSDSVATIGGATSTETGSIKNCSEAGCGFGAPLAVPNPASTPSSFCVVNQLSSDVSGTVDCSTGATTLSVPLSSILFFYTGDTATDPGSTIPGIQPCPLCSAGTCIGGPNNGMACVAGTSALNASYPTSNDCPPDPMFNTTTLPVTFALTSGTVTWSGTIATNDTGSTASVQNRVFSGFCRDAESSGAFEGTSPATAVPCWENGVAVGPACSGTFQSCEQRNNGAFGPAGGANRTIRAIGDPNGILGGPAANTLVSIFTIRPTFDPTVDAALDLPGPGAVAIPGIARTCPVASSCP